MYKVDFVSIDNFQTLKEAWLSLQNGCDMTFFQRFDWYNMLTIKNKNVRNSNFEIVFATVSKDNNIILIAPLWIIKKTFAKHNHRGVYIFGRKQWADYLNFIYDKFDAEAVTVLLKTITQQYGISRFVIDDIPSESNLNLFLEENYVRETASEAKCVHLDIPDSIDNYMNILSKNSRQNIRTANNRVTKDGISLVYNFDDKTIDINAFEKLRTIRVLKKEENYKRCFIGSIKLFISRNILKRYEYSFASYNPWTDATDTHFITAKAHNGDLCASFCYGMDKIHKRIVLMAVATNPDYYKYSPGVLALFHYILHQITTGEIKTLDFTRGDEKYKYSLGGVDHSNKTYSFQLNK